MQIEEQPFNRHSRTYVLQCGIGTLISGGGAAPGGRLLCRSCRMLNAGFLLPDVECRGPDCAVCGGCHEVSAWIEVAMSKGVSGEEIVGLLGRFRPLNLPLPTSRRSM